MKINIVITVVTCAIACLSACNKMTDIENSKRLEQSEGVVRWFSGYKMPELLADPIKLTSAKKLGEVTTRKWYAELQVYEESPPNKIMTLSSCDSYFAKSNLKLRTVSEKDNAPFMEIVMMCKATQLMLSATKPEKSFLQNIQFNKDLPSLLPENLALVISESEQARLNKDKSIKYWKDVNKIIKVDELGLFHANYQHSGGIQELELVAKGDFDGDQIEDMLLTSRDSVKEGSYSAIRLFMITRTSEASVVMAKEYIY